MRGFQRVMISKIKKLDELVEEIESQRKENKKIVFTNGCFDILHIGHIRYLKDARNAGDLLIIGLNSDSSVREIKGEKRPIVSQDQRAEVLSALYFVDYVVIFDDPDPYNIIKSIKPHVLVKGADWEEDQIIGGDFVKENGGHVERIELAPDSSTTLIIEKIIKLNL